MLSVADAKPEMIARSKTPGTIIPIRANDSIKEAPTIPTAIH